MKNTKGITLIALIITIIVTLILVGVSVVVSMREDGLIAQAIKSKTKTEETSCFAKARRGCLLKFYSAILPVLLSRCL